MNWNFFTVNSSGKFLTFWFEVCLSTVKKKYIIKNFIQNKKNFIFKKKFF